MGTIKDEIAKNLLYYRKKAGLTQKELAKRLGVANTAVSNWESGNNSIDIETLYLASSVFGVSLSDMYGKYASSEDVSAPALELTQDEKDLIAYYRDASVDSREDAALILRRSAERNKRSAQNAG